MACNPSSNTVVVDPKSAAEKAVGVIGMGYDLTADIRLSACKVGPDGSRLIELDEQGSATTRELVVPGGVVIPGVSTSIKCDKGERTRFRSDFLSFSQVSLFFFWMVRISGNSRMKFIYFGFELI